MLHNCSECKKEFKRYGSQVKAKNACCSKECSRELRRKSSVLARTKSCKQCKKVFIGQQKSSTFCSNKCSGQWQANAEKLITWQAYKKTCEVCEKEFLPPRPKEGGRFCSYKCSGISQRKPKILRAGYVYILVENHPQCSGQGYIAEHRLIMEKSVDRYLTSKEVVHHINFKKDDNRISNLQLMTRSDHCSYHANVSHLVNIYMGKACKEVKNDGRFNTKS